MSFLNFILRLPSLINSIYYDFNIIYEDDNIQWFVERWLKYVYFEPYTFCDILRGLGIKTPVVLSDFNETEGSFRCKPIKGQEVTISLKNRVSHEICITYNNETLIYSVGINYRSEIVTTFEGREMSKENKFLSSSFGPYFSKRKLKYDDGRILNIKIDVPNIYRCNLESARIKSQQNCQEIDTFLIDLPDDFALEAVYERVMRLLGYSDQELETSENVEFYYHINVGGINKILDRIEVEKGEITYWKSEDKKA